jgi:hypothetical protein
MHIEEIGMASETGRHQLYEELKQVVSEESANELMSYLPPVGWADVATKTDLGVIRTEMDALRAELRGEMAELRAELRGGLAELRGDMGQLRGDVGLELGKLHRSIWLAMASTSATTAGLVLAAVAVAG